MSLSNKAIIFLDQTYIILQNATNLEETLLFSNKSGQKSLKVDWN